MRTFKKLAESNLLPTSRVPARVSGDPGKVSPEVAQVSVCFSPAPLLAELLAWPAFPDDLAA